MINQVTKDVSVLSLLFVGIVTFSGCNRQSEELEKSEVEEGLSLMQAEIDNLKEQVSELRDEFDVYTAALKDLRDDRETSSFLLADHEERLENVETAIIHLNRREVAIDSSSTGFAAADAGIGKLLVSFQDAVPYLDGYKVTIQIGNPTSAAIIGFAIKANWSDMAAEQDANFENSAMAARNNLINSSAIQAASTRTQNFNFTDPLNPGAWTKVQMNVMPATAEEIKTLRISIIGKNVSLRKPSEK